MDYRAEIINGKPVLYRRTNNRSDWDDITHTLYSLDELEFYDLELNYAKFTELLRKLRGLIYTIKLGPKCYHVKFGDKLVWSYCADPFRRLPFELLFNLENNTMNLLFSDGTIRGLNMEGYDTDWPEPGKPLTKLNDTKLLTHEKLNVFLFSQEKRCYKLEICDKIIWKHEENRPFPLSCIVENDTFTLVFPINTPYITHNGATNDTFTFSFKP